MRKGIWEKIENLSRFLLPPFLPVSLKEFKDEAYNSILMWVGPNNLLLCSSLVVCGYCSPGLRLVALICRIRHRRPIAKLHQHHQKPPSLPAPGRGSSPNYHCCSPARDTRVAIDVQIPCSQIYLPDLFAQTLAIALMEVMTKKTSFCYFRVYPQLSVALYSDNPCLVLNVPS